MALRKAGAYSKKYARPYTRRSAKKSQSYIRTIPPQKLVKQYLENSFILYKPKDIVAGDFYWMETIQLDNVPISQYAD